MPRNLLFIAYYFPPLGMGGVQRSTKFVRYLPDFGWQPHVVTVKDIHYYAKDATLLDEIKHIPIVRSGSLDPARLARIFSLRGGSSHSRPLQGDAESGEVPTFSAARLLQRIFYPDSKILWTPYAARCIRRLMKKREFHAIFSTSPPVSAHNLAARFGIPWIADFRDYWSGGEGLQSSGNWRGSKRQKTMNKITNDASRIIAVSEPIAEAIRSFASIETRKKVAVIPNGFDPTDFAGVNPIQFDRFTISYLGNINPKTSPLGFLDVMDSVLEEQSELKEKLQVYFVGRHFGFSRNSIPNSLCGLVHFKDYVSHPESLAHALGSQVLLFLLSKDVEEGMMTGKIFEYLATGKPILAIIPKHAAAYQLLKKMPNCYFAEPDKPIAIKDAFSKLLQGHFGNTTGSMDPMRTPEYLLPFVRRKQAEQLAALLDECVEG